MSNQSKPKPRRNSAKYPGLEKSLCRRVVREYMDQDYIDKLSPKEKEWLSSFNEEWLSANFNHKGKKLHKSKAKKREIYNRNNARNRDLTSILKQRGHVRAPANLAQVSEEAQGTSHNNHEDVLITILDSQSKVKKS
jgi:hypothetical protein